MNVERLSTVTAMKKIAALILVLFAVVGCGDDGPTSVAQKVECVDLVEGSFSISCDRIFLRPNRPMA
jgi:uncharacterized protein YcfL